MYCKQCGNLLEDSQFFCEKCGMAASPTAKEQPNLEPLPAEPTECFTFVRHKSIARLDLSHTITEIEMNSTGLGVEQQKIVFYFFKREPTYTEISMQDITHVSVKGTFDVSDTLFAIILGTIGVLLPNIIFLLGAGVLLWIGYGKKIEIITKKRKRILIPTERNNNWTAFILSLKKANSNIILNK